MKNVYKNTNFFVLTVISLLFFSTEIKAQNCFNSATPSFINDCGNCVFETDSLANNCQNLETACGGDVLNIYLDNSLSLSTSDSLPEIIRSQIEADFCADGGNIIDCYCNLLPELESFVLEHTFTQNGEENNSQLLDFINYEDDYLRLIIQLDTAVNAGELIYEIVLERDIIMNCYLCNDQVCIDENIGIPFEEKLEIPINIKNDCNETAEPITNFQNIAAPTFKIYPNPTSDFLHFPNATTDFKIAIFNTEGKNMGNFQNTTSIEVSNLPNGLYFISFEKDNYNFRSQFLKF